MPDNAGLMAGQSGFGRDAQFWAMSDESSVLAPPEQDPWRERCGVADSAIRFDTLWRLKLLNEFQVADLLNLRVSILRRRRSRGLPPTFVRISGQIRYRPADLMTFINSMRNSPRQGPEEA
jgi:hypothetical protein